MKFVYIWPNGLWTDDRGCLSNKLSRSLQLRGVKKTWKPGIHLAIPGLVVQCVIHNTTAAPKVFKVSGITYLCTVAEVFLPV